MRLFIAIVALLLFAEFNFLLNHEAYVRGYAEGLNNSYIKAQREGFYTPEEAAYMGYFISFQIQCYETALKEIAGLWPYDKVLIHETF